MIMASLWKLPVIYVCENNLYNEYTSYEDVTAGSISARAEAFGIPAEEVDGQDVLAVYEATERAVARARRGEGPSFLVCATYRYHGHHVGDVDRAYYRAKEEEELWRTERDPLARLSSWLVERKLSDEVALQSLREEAAAEVQEGVRFALETPFPDAAEVT